MPAELADPLTLPCGITLKNRIAKAAMTEGIATPENRATSDHARLYRRWAQGGSGLLITGNVQVDRRFLERPGNITIDGNGGLDALADYARAGSENGAHIWMQINHPGRQAGTGTDQFVSPSENNLPGKEGRTRALKPDEIEDICARFIHVAQVAHDTGFTGIQIHAAHGYLLSQFLSPLTNRRDDQWGGSLKNRSRLLLDIVRGIRAKEGANFAVSVKLNSADFQKGGLTEEESFQIVRWLCEAGIDLLEVSGGNYESQIMVGRDENHELVKKKPASTTAREAYFLEFAARLRPQVSVPLMVTGGFRSRQAMEQALLANELDLIGLARPLCIDPDFANQLLSGNTDRLPSPDDAISLNRSTVGDVDEATLHAIEVQASISYYFNQVRRLAAGEESEQEIDWLEQLNRHVAFDAAANKRYLAAA